MRSSPRRPRRRWSSRSRLRPPRASCWPPPAASKLLNPDLSGADVAERVGGANHQRPSAGVRIQPNLERLLAAIENAVARERRLPALRIERVFDLGHARVAVANLG